MEVSGTSNFRVLGNGKKGRKLVYIKKKNKTRDYLLYT